MRHLRTVLGLIFISPLILSLIFFQILIGIIMIIISPITMMISIGSWALYSDWGYLEAAVDFATFPSQILLDIFRDI
jgi:hypothetical protein